MSQLSTSCSRSHCLELQGQANQPAGMFVGELGLTGEVRRVNRIEQRINEAAKLGFTKIYVPKNSLTGI